MSCLVNFAGVKVTFELPQFIAQKPKAVKTINRLFYCRLTNVKQQKQ